MTNDLIRWIDEGADIWKVISIEKVEYILNTLSKTKKMGVLNRSQRMYGTYRRRYFYCLPNQTRPNIGRRKHALALGFSGVKDGHYFEIYNAYGISCKIVDDNADDVIYVFLVEEIKEANKEEISEFKFYVIEGKDIKINQKRRNLTDGGIDYQYIIPLDSFKVFEQGIKLENIKIEQKL